jgi:hypothetical protein
MTESEDTKKRIDRRIDILYRNLEHVSNAYFSVESVFPIWEAAFALIVGQLIVAYFNPEISIYQQQLLAFIGLIISSIWFILVSLNFQNALHMDGKIRDLHNRINIELEEEDYLSDLSFHDFIKPWPEDEDKKKWTVRKIFWGTEERIDKVWFNKTIRSTWFYRRVLPFTLSVIWILLLAWQILGLLGVVVISIIIMQLISLCIR